MSAPLPSCSRSKGLASFGEVPTPGCPCPCTCTGTGKGTARGRERRVTTSYDSISQRACQLPQRRPGARRDSPAARQRRSWAATTSAAAPDPRTGSRPRDACPWLPGTRSRRCPGRQCQTLCRVRRERGEVMSGPTAEVVHLPRGTWRAEFQHARAPPRPPPGPARSPPTGPGPAQDLASPGLRSCSGTCLASQRPRVSEDLPGPSTRSVSRHFLRCDMPAKRGGGCGGGHSGSVSSGESAHAAAQRIRAMRQPWRHQQGVYPPLVTTLTAVILKAIGAEDGAVPGAQNKGLDGAAGRAAAHQEPRGVT